jgi:hypothetical protein
LQRDRGKTGLRRDFSAILLRIALAAIGLILLAAVGLIRFTAGIVVLFVARSVSGSLVFPQLLLAVERFITDIASILIHWVVLPVL